MRKEFNPYGGITISTARRRQAAKLVDLDNIAPEWVRLTRKYAVPGFMPQSYDPLSNFEVFVFMRNARPLPCNELFCYYADV